MSDRCKYWVFVVVGVISMLYQGYLIHYRDVIMGAIASAITSFTIVYSDADKKTHQISAPLAFVRGIHKWPVTRKMFPFDDVIMHWSLSATCKQPRCYREITGELIQKGVPCWIKWKSIHMAQGKYQCWEYDSVLLKIIGTGEFPAQRASNAENISIWWRHHDFIVRHAMQSAAWVSRSCGINGPLSSQWKYMRYLHFRSVDRWLTCKSRCMFSSKVSTQLGCCYHLKLVDAH